MAMGPKGIMVYLHEAQEELQGLERSEEQKDEIERELEVREAQLLSMAEQLSRKRGVAAKQMARLILQE